MSILIKGMEMLSTCEECNLESFCDKWIDARKMCGEWELGVKATIRHPDCPLVPVPPHGRLIDADEIKESIRKQTAFLRLIGGEFAEIAEIIEKGFLQEIDNAPTIIEAEKESA